jgi:DDE superfamily endonuclease/Tc5 transposase-like DNA-binding protein
LKLRSAGIPVTDKYIIRKAISLKKQLNLEIDCVFSNGWLQNFKNRHNIVSRKGGSKIIRKDDCELSVILNFVKLVNKKINSGKFELIMNIDEMGICYDPDLAFTLEIKGTNRVDIKTTGRERERITIILGIDFLNNIKMKPLLIFKGTTEKCLNNVPKSNSYNLGYQENAWCFEGQFINFLSFLPRDKKILLIYDNFGAHITEKVNTYIKKKLPLIEILLLPPNTTSILQPLDTGINKSFKSYVKDKYLEWLVEYFDENEVIPKLMLKDRKKLFVKWISEAWNNIDDTMIQNSFNVCGYGIPNEIEPKCKKFVNI